MSVEYTYSKAVVNLDKLTLEIEADATIQKTLEYMNDDNGGSNNLHIFFDLTLTSGEETALDTLVTNHDGNPPTIYTRFCRCCLCTQHIPALSEPTTCPCCDNTDCLVSCPMTDNFALYEVHEHFLENFYDVFTGAGGSVKYGKFYIEANAYVKDSATILKLSTAALEGEAIGFHGVFSHNPYTYSYYQLDWYWKLDSVNIADEVMGIVDTDDAETSYCYIKKGTNVGTVKLITTADGISFTTTDNITQDITAYAEYTIKIKSGHVYLFIDEVQKAHHTTNIPFNVSEGMRVSNYIPTSENVSRHYYIDYMDITLGRAF